MHPSTCREFNLPIAILMLQERRAKADTPCKWRWEDALYQWRANEKPSCLFELLSTLTSLGQVMPHSKYNKEWKLWFVVAACACRLVARVRRRLDPSFGAALREEYNKYYKDAPCSQDSSDPDKKLRDKDHWKRVRKFRKSRYAADSALKLQYRRHA